MANPKSILMVVTSHDRIDADHSTGLWYEEFAAPFALFEQAGYRVAVASPKGGSVPIDPRSMPESPDLAADQAALAMLANTVSLDSVDAASFDAVFFPGGHGTMYDLPDNPQVAELVGRFADDDKVVASVCHGPASLVGARRADGTPLVAGRRVTAFTNAEEAAVELDGLMPFLLESRLRELGARVETSDNWDDHVVVDGKLVTGQNPQSSASAARAVVKLLQGEHA
ncbi:MAG TPA: type 1 glutamine amidotransferase domain-containing protein [Gammaproteobacteria bacterium]|nr:type 1 glutamine amidotransferase domain-containing protein [Gammaproteobacteria bacterium]